eukprot:7304905-Lingulodinium_polyedra.AAC.1
MAAFVQQGVRWAGPCRTASGPCARPAGPAWLSRASSRCPCQRRRGRGPRPLAAVLGPWAASWSPS